MEIWIKIHIWILIGIVVNKIVKIGAMKIIGMLSLLMNLVLINAEIVLDFWTLIVIGVVNKIVHI